MSGSRVGIQRGDFELYSEVGRWWYGEDEIDIVGLAPNDIRILLAESKWTADPVGKPHVESLPANAVNARWDLEDRDERFALFSKNGFVGELEAEIDTNWTQSLTEIDEFLTSSVL